MLTDFMNQDKTGIIKLVQIHVSAQRLVLYNFANQIFITYFSGGIFFCIPQPPDQ